MGYLEEVWVVEPATAAEELKAGVERLRRARGRIVKLPNLGVGGTWTSSSGSFAGRWSAACRERADRSVAFRPDRAGPRCRSAATRR